MSLILDNVGHTYHEGTAVSTRALEGVTMEIERGELVLVVGETGSGKSTLLRIAAGLMSPTTGRATVDGVPVGAPGTRGAMGLVFQDAESQLFADSIFDDVAFGPRNLGLEPTEVEQATISALETVGLDPFAYGPRSPFTLSGGEARRAAIAGVLAMRPRYLLADEPTSALDVGGRRAVIDAVRSAREHAGVMIVSHSPEEFLDDADRVLVLHSASVAWYGDADRLLREPSVFARSGLVVPDVAAVQLEVARRLGVRPEPVLDAARAAAWIEDAVGGWSP